MLKSTYVIMETQWDGYRSIESHPQWEAWQAYQKEHPDWRPDGYYQALAKYHNMDLLDIEKYRSDTAFEHDVHKAVYDMVLGFAYKNQFTETLVVGDYVGKLTEYHTHYLLETDTDCATFVPPNITDLVIDELQLYDPGCQLDADMFVNVDFAELPQYLLERVNKHWLMEMHAYFGVEAEEVRGFKVTEWYYPPPQKE